MDERNVSKPAMRGHKLVLNNRTASLVTGVKDVLSFDLNEVLLETEQGMLMVKGTDLHVNRLSLEKGILTVLLIRMCMQNKNRERIYLHVCFVNVCGKLQESQ